MNEKTLKAIQRHGQSLLLAFPNAIEKDPVVLCKKLRRIETFIASPILDNCNYGLPDDVMDRFCNQALTRLCKLLGIVCTDVNDRGIFVNLDPRGAALKIGSEWTKDWNNAMRQAGKLTIHQDWGQYGILAPDLNQ